MNRTAIQSCRQYISIEQKDRILTQLTNEYLETTARLGSTRYTLILINYCQDTRYLRQNRLRIDEYTEIRIYKYTIKYSTLQTFNTMLQMRIKSTRQTCKCWTMLTYNLYNLEYISIKSIELQRYRVTLLLLRHY